MQTIMDSPSEPSPAPSVASEEDKTVAILSYVTLIGFIIAIVIHNGKKTQIGAFHLRQALGLFITGAVLGIALMITVVGLFLIPFMGIALFIFAIIGLINAAQGQMKPLPLVGPLYQKWFANAFA